MRRMSRHKFAVPATVVIGSKPKLDPVTHEHQIGVREPLFTAAKRPVGSRLLKPTYMWEEGKKIGEIAHFRNEAAKRKAGGDLTKADKSEIVIVPVYRGAPARLMNGIRAGQRRAKKKTMVERIRAAFAARKGSDVPA